MTLSGTGDEPAVPARNWAGSYSYGATRLHAPSSLDALRRVLASTPRLRVLGSRHSFTGMADSDELVSLHRLPEEVQVDRSALTATVGGGLSYGRLAEELDRAGLALPNLASLPHIAVAGAISTATHGSGHRNGNLATSVAALELVTSDGELRHVERGDEDFDAIVVGLGAVGAIVRVTLDVLPAYEVRQQVFERLRWETLFEHFHEIMACGYSVSAFCDWGEVVDQVWVKTRVGASSSGQGDLFGAAAAPGDRHPIPGLDPANCTPQLGEPGPWWDRLPHFRMGFVPSSGEELQSEYIVPAEHGVEAVKALRPLAAVIRPLLLVTEIRTIAADSLWMSPQCGQDTVAIHFTWKRRPEPVLRALAEIERTLAPYRARPHWGKLFLAHADAIQPLYERFDDFAALLDRLDPRGAFRNEWLQTHVLGRP